MSACGFTAWANPSAMWNQHACDDAFNGQLGIFEVLHVRNQ
jgi:hypothetical protein